MHDKFRRLPRKSLLKSKATRRFARGCALQIGVFFAVICACYDAYNFGLPSPVSQIESNAPAGSLLSEQSSNFIEFSSELKLIPESGRFVDTNMAPMNDLITLNSNSESSRALISGKSECEVNMMLITPYFLLLLYVFVGVAVICDEYFEPALSEITEQLQLSDDVAGATFMAAGSSAPELFTSLVDAFGPSESIGVGTIVGSAMFNVLIIIALSAAVTDGSVKLDWRPIARDVSFYLLSIFLLLLYIQFAEPSCYYEEGAVPNLTLASGYYSLEKGDELGIEASQCLYADVGIFEGVMFISAYGLYILFMVFNSRILSYCGPSSVSKVHDEAQAGDEVEKKPEDEEDEGDGDGVFDVPPSLSGKLIWVILLPMNILFFLTVPRCDKEHLKKFFLVSFFMCTLWLAGLSYAMIILAIEIGCQLKIDPVVMGVTFLAAGTSVPDAIASMVVARKGQADMAIANAVGSNVFDILLGLGIPWILVEIILKRKTHISNQKIGEYTFILVGTVVLYVLSIIVNRWSMSKELGYFYLVLYGGYLVYVFNG